MSEENVELWLKSVDAWNRGDRETWLRDVPPEWEFQPSGLFPGLKAVYRGPEGASELWETMREPWDTFEVAVERVEDLGDTLVGLVTFKVQGRDGLKTSRQWAYVVTFSGGVPVRTNNFATWQEALEAAGLSE
jgi:ketosteroid isomerase-like protein